MEPRDGSGEELRVQAGKELPFQSREGLFVDDFPKTGGRSIRQALEDTNPEPLEESKDDTALVRPS